jgi:hypothetical protein
LDDVLVNLQVFDKLLQVHPDLQQASTSAAQAAPAAASQLPAADLDGLAEQWLMLQATPAQRQADKRNKQEAQQQQKEQQPRQQQVLGLEMLQQQPHLQQQPMQQQQQAIQQQQQQQQQQQHDAQAAAAQLPWDLIPPQQTATGLQPPQDPYQYSSAALTSTSNSSSSSNSISQPGGAGSSSSSGSSSSGSDSFTGSSSSSSTLLPPIDPEAVEASVAAALDSLTEADLRFDAAELAAAWLPCCSEVVASNKVFTKKQCEKLAAAGLNNMLQVGEDGVVYTTVISTDADVWPQE